MGFDFIAKPFGILMEFIYNTLAFKNYGIAILIFTVIIKILLMPLQIKQQRSMIKQQEIQPELQELQKTYANDRTKLAEEQQKLYAKYNISMTAGCLPLLIQFPLIMALYQIIRQPLTYISGLSANAIGKIAEVLGFNAMNELQINNALIKDSSLLEKVSEWMNQSDIINMNFLKIFDLGETPAFNPKTIIDKPGLYLPLLLIPILSGVSAILMQRMSMARVNQNKKDDKKQEGPNVANGMMKFMPIMSFVIAFTVPAGLGLYWTISNVLSMGQMALINRIIAKQKEGRL